MDPGDKSNDGLGELAETVFSEVPESRSVDNGCTGDTESAGVCTR